MKLSNISIIFIIIVLPIILLLSYYISLQIDTINMQTAYTAKQVQATKEAVEAFEINTVEWNQSYSTNADSKRRDVMASINTFTTSFANSLGIGGTNKENILTYIPAIAVTLYDGYYIYTPSETKQVIKDENGVAVFLKEKIVKADNSPIEGYEYETTHEGRLLYEYDSENENGINADGVYKYVDADGNYIEEQFTLNPSGAKSTYEHILKPYTTYSARYKKDDTDITVNYTLDNYITIYGTVNGEYTVKSGYLIAPQDGLELAKENLTEKIAWKWNEDEEYTCKDYIYVYAEDNTKVYFDGNTTFQVSGTGIRTDLNETTGVKYKRIRKNSEEVTYQALNDGTVEITGTDGTIETRTIVKGKLYLDKKGNEDSNIYETIEIGADYSSRNYYIESTAFTKWVQLNLSDITIGNMQNVADASLYGDLNTAIFISTDPESEDSDINRHKREIIKQTLISNLNQAITSYGKNAEGEYTLPILTETDWNHVLRNVSIITFLQNIPIGMKYYNNYAIATSTNNKEYVNPDEMYFVDASSDIYYHLPYCSKMHDSIIGYRNIDYLVNYYEDEDGIHYYYKHNKNQACYYCIIQRDLYEKKSYNGELIEYYKNVAIARERYRNLTQINLQKDLEYNIKVTLDSNGGTCDKSEIWVAYQGKYVGIPEATIEGFDFLGWYTDSGNRITESTTVTKTEDHTLLAKYALKSYTVTFNANGGTPSSQNVPIQYQAPYYLPQQPVMIGYDFQGWYTEQTGGEEITEETIMGRAENHTLYAHWYPKVYEVTFDANGGTLQQGTESTKLVEYNNNYGDLPTPTREGYMFAGWYTERNGGDRIGDLTKLTRTENHTLYAHWVKTHIVTFDANGGTPNSTIQVISGGKYESYLPSPEPTREGYRFVGWFTSSVGGTQVTSNTIITTEENHTLYAHWTPEPYRLELNPNGGTLEESEKYKTITYGSMYGTLPTPTRDGYYFEGWYTAATGGTKVMSSSTVTIAGTHTLYAHWVTAYTVNYNASGGSGAPSAQTKIHGQDLTLSTQSPTRTGYTFKGWATVNNSITAQYQPGGIYTGNSNVTLYAVWEQQNVPVTGVTITPSADQWIPNSDGSTVTLTATVSPSNATNNTVTWSSSSTDVATVSNNGTVTAKNPGKTTITVTTTDSRKTDNVDVYVYNVQLNSGKQVYMAYFGGDKTIKRENYHRGTIQSNSGNAKFVVKMDISVTDPSGTFRLLYDIKYDTGNYTSSTSTEKIYLERGYLKEMRNNSNGYIYKLGF